MSKQLNKQLRLIIGQAYETELERELDALKAEFRRWRSQEIDAFELEARIHRFHNGPARKLWSTYVEGPTSMLSFNVAGAIVRGIVPREDVPTEVLLELEPAIESFQRVVGDGASKAGDGVE